MAEYNQSMRKHFYSSEKWWWRTVSNCLLKKLYQSVAPFFLHWKPTQTFYFSRRRNGAQPQNNFVYGQKLLFRSTSLNHPPISYQKIGVHSVEIQRRNKVPITGTPLVRSKNVKFRYNTITALGFTESGNGIKLELLGDNHFISAFDLTSTE